MEALSLTQDVFQAHLDVTDQKLIGSTEIPVQETKETTGKTRPRKGTTKDRDSDVADSERRLRRRRKD